MRNKKIVNIGDIFLSWRVIELINPKKYRYKCKCTECGIEREFVKYNLLKGSYAPCKKCGHKKLANIPLIKKHWNCELNGAIFDNPENFSLTQSYWFVCDNGHNFKSSIKDFRLDRCIACTEYPPNHPSKTEAKEFALQYFRTVSSVKELEHYLIYISEFNVVLHLHESDRYSLSRTYFKSENEIIAELDLINNTKSKLQKVDIGFIQVPLSKNLKDNVDTFKQLMIQLIHRFN